MTVRFFRETIRAAKPRAAEESIVALRHARDSRPLIA
jgi:hypothetical protein